MYRISVKDLDNCWHSIDLRFYYGKEKLFVKNVISLQIFKFHNHRYDVKVYFFQRDFIFCQDCLRSLREVDNVVQSLLQKYL